MILELIVLILLPLFVYVGSVASINRLVRKELSSSLFKWSGVIGTTAHEFNHLLMCIICFLKVKRVSFFKPTEDGSLGFVEYSFNPRSLRHRLSQVLVGYAPLYLGAIMVFLLTKSLLGVSVLEFGSSSYMDNYIYCLILIRDGLYNDLLISLIWLVVTFCVMTHSLPSDQDIKGSFFGVILMLFTIVIMTLVSVSFMGEAEFYYLINDWARYFVLLITSLSAISSVLLIAVLVASFIKRIFCKLILA
jgi:hypothetical protein